MKNPLITVIMPVYNGDKFLKKAIDSILNQTFQDFEFIIINDGSTDGTLEILNAIRDERMIIINQENKGLVFSLNYGFGIAKGDWIARMDSDDITYPDRFEKQFKYISDDVAVIGSQADLIDQYDKIYDTTKFELEHEKIVSKLSKHKSTIIHPSVIINKSKFNLTGGYDNKLQHAEDTDLWLRISKVGKIINVDKPLLALRKHSNNISRIKLETATINSYVSLAHYYRSNSIDIMSENEYKLLFNIISNFVLPYTKRCVLLETIKEKRRLIPSSAKYLYMIFHPFALMNYLIIIVERIFIILKIKRLKLR